MINLLEIKDNDFGLNINEVIDKFFKKFKLKLVVLNHNDEVIFKYQPDKINKNISITTMRIKQFNNHIVLLNDNINHVD